MEVDPAAIQAFATFLADAKSQLDYVKAQFDTPNATAEHFGRSWQAEGDQYALDWAKFAPDLASLSTLLDQITAQLTSGAELTLAAETTSLGEFTKIAASADAEAPPSEAGGI
jgi:uncharacterized protein YukE